MKIWILHAGLNHPSPYFYNLNKELQKYNNVKVIIHSEFPKEIPGEKGIVYFNRLKRYYDSADVETIHLFLEKVDELKKMGWIIAFTLHNFFPIDQDYNENDFLMLNLFIKKVDIVFTFTNYMKNSIKKLFNVNAICHLMGVNELDGWFNQNQVNLDMINDGDFVFTFVGNVSKYKMLPEFIEAFNQLRENNVWFIIAGPLSRNFSIQLNNNRIIRFNNFIGDMDWEKLCQKTNIFINSYDIDIPSFKYGFFPSNCIQISYNKKICLVPKTKIMRELLPKGYYYEYNSKDIDYLTALLSKIVKDKNRIKNKERNYPVVDYSWEKTCRIIIDEFKKYE